MRGFAMTLEALEKRVKALEDVEEIKKLHIDYILALNEQKFEKMIDCFVDDAIIDGIEDEKCEGKEAIARFFRAMAKRQRAVKMWKGGQILVHPVISVKGDNAKGYWTWYRISVPRKFTSDLGHEVTLIAPAEARYDMEYKRVNGKWKMSKLKFTSPWPEKQWPR
jgi:ketosteroid isomerase-like protein